MSEKERIRSVYADRDRSTKRDLYAWYRPEVRRQEFERLLVVSNMLYHAIGDDLSDISMIDVGCGTGGFLRSMIEWGAKADNLVGTEFLDDRIEQAKVMSPAGIQWHVGGLDVFDDAKFDLVVANTVFSSILDDEQRKQLAGDMWRVMKPGGWLLIFDFRYNNPSNKNVRKVTESELRMLWDGVEHMYKSVILAPPVSRRLSKFGFISDVLVNTFPFLRSHFIYMAKK